MDDLREKVIKGLECCTVRGSCQKCPYYFGNTENPADSCAGYAERLLLDALTLLKKRKPHILSPDEFGECGTGWIEHWCRLENDDGTLREPEVFMDRCAWCGNSLTTGEFLISLDIDIQKDYGKADAGGFRVWAGDFAPSDEMRKEAAWDE